MKVYRIEELEVPERQPLPPEAWLTVRDAAAWLGVSRMTILRYAEEGKLSSVEEASAGRYGHRLMVSTSDLNVLAVRP